MTLDVLTEPSMVPPELDSDARNEAANPVEQPLPFPRARQCVGIIHIAPLLPRVHTRSVVIGGYYSTSFLRSPYAESAEWLDRPVHAVTRSRGGNQSTLLSAPDSRYERANPATETPDPTRASYDHLPWRAS